MELECMEGWSRCHSVMKLPTCLICTHTCVQQRTFIDISIRRIPSFSRKIIRTNLKSPLQIWSSNNDLTLLKQIEGFSHWPYCWENESIVVIWDVSEHHQLAWSGQILVCSVWDFGMQFWVTHACEYHDHCWSKKIYGSQLTYCNWVLNSGACDESNRKPAVCTVNCFRAAP